MKQDEVSKRINDLEEKYLQIENKLNAMIRREAERLSTEMQQNDKKRTKIIKKNIK